MKLQAITITNFQGTKYLEVKLGGRSMSVYGDNATGKTTLFNAITWLLFDKASTGAKGFNPKTKGPNGDLHKLEHSVEATFSMADGAEVTLKKVFKEDWRKKRGTAQEEFSGHKVEYFINGVPTKEKEYTASVMAYSGCDSEQLKILTMPDYFPATADWKARRTILLEVCGNVSDEDVISSTDELKDLPSFLRVPGSDTATYSIEDYLKIANARRREINSLLDEIPARVDEVEKSIPANPQDPDKINREIAELESRKRDLEIRARDITEEAKARQGKLSELRSQLHAETERCYREYEAKNAKLFQEYKDALQTMRSLEDKCSSLKYERVELAQSLTSMKNKRQEILSEIHKIQEQRFDASSAVCSLCGQHLPPEQVGKLASDFALRSSNRVKELIDTGRREASSDAIAAFEKQLSKIDLEREATNLELNKWSARVDALVAEKEAVPPFPMYPDSDRGKQLSDEIDALMADLESSGIDDLRVEMDELSAQIVSKYDELRSVVGIENARKRISELEAQERELAKEYEHCEHGIFLCEEFVRAKVGMLTGKINSKFKTVRFNLFKEQINGGLTEDCEVMIPADGGQMVPYSLANNAAKINAGLEIISVLSDFWGITMPVVIDNAESVTHLVSTATQTIKLYVSEPDKTLRFELE